MNDEYDIIVDELDEETCWRLLARAGFGRVGFVKEEAVIVLPVNSAVSDGRVIFRTAGDASLAAAGDGSVVAFEADHTDRVAESGWSVVVRGRGRETDPPEPHAEESVVPWAPGVRDHWVRIDAETISGRRITQADDSTSRWWRLSASG